MSPKKKRYNKNKYTKKASATGGSLSNALGNTPNGSPSTNTNTAQQGKVIMPTASSSMAATGGASQNTATWSAGKSSASQASTTNKSYVKPSSSMNSTKKSTSAMQSSRKVGVPDDVYKRRWRFRRIIFFLILGALLILGYLLFGRGSLGSLFGNNTNRGIDRETTNLQNELNNLEDQGNDLLNGNVPGIGSNPGNPDGDVMVEKKIIDTPAAIDTVRVNISESFPVQASVVIAGSVADGCTELSRTPVQYNSLLKRFTIDVVGQKEDNPDIACTAALQPFNETIPLNIVGLDSGNYSVSVNGEMTSFNLEMPNTVDFGGDKG